MTWAYRAALAGSAVRSVQSLPFDSTVVDLQNLRIFIR